MLYHISHTIYIYMYIYIYIIIYYYIIYIFIYMRLSLHQSFDDPCVRHFSVRSRHSQSGKMKCCASSISFQKENMYKYLCICTCSCMSVHSCHVASHTSW